jgi:hypothetical protein
MDTTKNEVNRGAEREREREREREAERVRGLTDSPGIYVP